MSLGSMIILLMRVACVCVVAVKPTESTCIRPDASPLQHTLTKRNSAGGYFWMAGYGNETIPAFPCSDSARVDGMGRWWTSGREKKNMHFDTAIVGSALSLSAL